MDAKMSTNQMLILQAISQPITYVCINTLTKGYGVDTDTLVLWV